VNVAGFIDLLTRSGLDVTPLDVAEVLWLARYATPPARQAPGEPPHAPPDPDPGEAEAPSEAGNGESGTPGAPADQLPLHLPWSSGTGRISLTGPGVSVPVPASTALPGSLALMRALRPLKLRAPDVRRRTLDETATVDATARSGALMPVLRAGSERRFSLALVVDTGPAMAVWAKLEAELLVALQRLAAFRELQRWYLHTDRGRMLGISHSARASPAPRDPAELLDPAGRRVILVLTDGAGSAWRSGALARTLRLWGSAGPVAILEPLPQQLWSRTALSPVRGRLTAARPAAPNAELEFTPRGRAARWHRLVAAAKNAAAPPPVPIPVLEIGPDWLRGWARLVGVAQGTALDCAVTLVSAHLAPEPSVPAPEPPDVTAEDRIRQFVEQASPEAQRLASCLAAAPLSLPVMRHVQQAMLPGSGPSHLAEVLLGGLVTTRGVPGEPDESRRWRYEFAPGVRDLLLSGLGRADARRVLATVSRELNARFGRGADEFAGVVPVPGAHPTISATSRPFAEIATHVLGRITGAVTIVPADGPLAPDAGAELPATLIRRYQRTGRITDLDAAIAALRRVTTSPYPVTRQTQRAVTSPADATTALELAAALRTRYLGLADPEDLDEAIDVLRQVVRDAPSGDAMSRVLEQLATALGLRHARTGSRADLEEAVAAAATATGSVREGSKDFPRYAATLAGLLLRRGSPEDLRDAVAWLRRASAHMEALARDDRAKLCADLSTALRAGVAYNRAGGETRTTTGPGDADLGEAIDLMRRAIELSGDDKEAPYGIRAHELAERYAGLGAVLLDRGQVSGDAAALREAAESYGKAVSLAAPGHPETGAYLTGQGVALRELAAASGLRHYADEAVTTLRQAVGETLPEDPQMPRRQTELAAALIARFGFEGHRGDLIEARHLLTEGIPALASSLGAGHPDTLSARLELARIFAAEGRDADARTILTEVLPSLPHEHPSYQAAHALEESLR
jgi:tetratricopeptide (TPR) repeat protein